MDFFEAQEKSRQTSRWLVWWFMLCVLGVILALYAIAVPLVAMLAEQAPHTESSGLNWIDPGLFLTVAIFAGGIIIGGSLYKRSALSAGGEVVARDLGAREIDRLTTDFYERRVINVVEEMSIAAGAPMPGVWVMDEEMGINAFAAGTDPANAVIGITRGAIHRLNREELQGVIAHEFSHILNGDMRLNMSLTGWVFGLLMIVILGRTILQMLRFSGGGRSSRSSGDRGGGMLLIIAIGASLWIIGSLGAFFARWLQAAVSRQREYLADASAVQFTRNPPGIANALRKIGGGSTNSVIRSASASEARHLFFAKSDLMDFAMATHPPLPKRIKAVLPQWDGTMLESKPADAPPQPKAKPSKGFAGMPPPFPGALGEAVGGATGGALGGHGAFNPVLLGALAGDIDEKKPDSIRSVDDAKALIHGLLFAADADTQTHGIELITNQENAEIAERAQHWHQKLHEESTAAKLVRVDQSLPWLKGMGRPQAEAFIATNRALIKLDGKVSLFEFMIEQVIDRNVAIATGLRPVPPMRHRKLESLEREIAILVGVFASIGGGEEPDAAARREYREHTGRDLPKLPAESCTLADAADALPELDASTPLVKSRVLRICRLVATADDVLDDAEVELLRAVADAIGAPTPRVAHSDTPA